MEESDYRNQIPAKLSAYIALCGLRNTPERYEILEAAQALDVETKPFSAGQVYQQYRASGGRAARLTVYHTVELMERASILVKVPILVGNGIGYIFQYHFLARLAIICNECGELAMYKRTRLLRNIEVIATPGYLITGHSLYLYGLCKRCQRLSKNKELRKAIRAQKERKKKI